MKSKFLFLMVGLFLFSIDLSAQASIRQAAKLYDNLGYKKSIPHFENSDKLSTKELAKIANSYRLNHETENAELWYQLVVEKSKEPIHKLHYAQALQSNKKYDLAKQYFEEYNASVTNEDDNRGIVLATAIEHRPMIKHTADAIVRNERKINTGKLDFSPSYHEDGIVFVSTRKVADGERKKAAAVKDIWIDDNFMALFQASKDEEGDLLVEPKEFSLDLTTKFHEGPVSFTKDGNRIFFTRNDYLSKKRRNNSKGIMKLQIYTAHKSGDEWSKPMSLPFNTQEYEEAHPTVTPDGSRLYFASDRPEGYGGMDIYVSKFKGGKWSAPINLGEKVNTPGNEAFPFYHEDDVLYFASDGLGGIGGLDIHSVQVMGAEELGTVENIGTPFNSEKDDFGFICSAETTDGYFTSARDGGLGKDDIYSFRKGEAPKTTDCLALEGVVKNKKTGTIISNAYVTMVNLCTGEEVIVKSGSNGEFAFPCLDCDCEFTFKGEKVHFTQDTNKASTMGLECNKGGMIETAVLLELSPEEAPPVATTTTTVAPTYTHTVPPVYMGSLVPANTICDNVVTTHNPNYSALTNTTTSSHTTHSSSGIHSNMIIELQNIFYDFDQFYIRDGDAKRDLDKVVSMMNQYPSMTIELGSHTDARGTTGYNRRLSQNRANAAVDYIINKGISRNRVTARGYGESQLRNHCENYAECTEEEHQENRRTEVKIIEFNEPGVSVRNIDNNPERTDPANPNRKWIWD